MIVSGGVFKPVKRSGSELLNGVQVMDASWAMKT